MKTQHHRLGIRCAEFFHHFCPHAAGSPELGNFFKKVIVCVEKKRKPFAEYVYVETFCYSRLHICLAVTQRESEFLNGCTSSLTDMVTRNRYRVPFGQLMAAPFENIGNNTHRRFRRIDISSPCCIFFQYIILYSTTEFFEIGSLSFRRNNVQAKQDKCSSIDRHGSRYLVEPY